MIQWVSWSIDHSIGEWKMEDEKIKAVISGNEPYAHIGMENRNPPYAHITLRITMPRVQWSDPRVVIELSAQVGSDSGKEEPFMRPYAIQAGIACSIGSTVDLASAEAGIKPLRRYDRLKTKYEAGPGSPATFPVLAQMLLFACKCNYLIHEPDIGWEKWPHDLTTKTMSLRGVASLRVFEKMVATLEDFARTC